MFKISNRLQKTIDKTTEKFVDRLYHNKKYRDSVRKSFKGLEESALSDLEKLQNVYTLKESKDRAFAEEFLDMAEKGLDTYKIVERRLKAVEIYDCKFKLYKEVKGNKYVFINDYIKGPRKIPRRSYILLLGSFPKTGRRKVILGKYKDFDTNGYLRIDEGVFKQTRLHFTKLRYIFYGKKKYKFMLESSSASNLNNLWIYKL